MRKRSSKAPKKAKHPPVDANTAAFEAIAKLTDDKAESGKNPAAVYLGRLGGRKGGPARAKSLTKAQRRDIAMKAAQARWGNQRSDN